MPRFDSTTGKRRRFFQGWRLLAAGLAVAVLAGSGIAVAAAASTAEAHNRSVDVTCQGITIHGDNYNTGSNGTDVNTVTVTISGSPATDDSKRVSPITFATNYDGFFAFPDVTTGYAYTAKIEGHDGYKAEKVGTSPICAPPTLSIKPATCTVAGGTVDLVADVSGIDGSHSYTIALSSSEAGATNVAATAFAPGAATGSKTFPGVSPGHHYTVTIVDTTTGLQASADSLVVGCPQDSDIDVTPTECTVPGGSGGFAVNLTNLSNGRVYVVTVLNTAGVLQSSKEVTGDATGIATVPFDVIPGGSYKATVADKIVGASSLKTSKVFSYLFCPKTPVIPAVDPGDCTSTNGTPNSTLTFSASDLVPGRSYQVTVSGGAYDSGPFTATASAWPVVTTGPQSMTIQVPPGDYTVTVVDLKLTSFVTTGTAHVGECPKLPDLALTPTQCTVPGGTASIATTITNYIAGRVYNIGVTQVQGGAVVVPTAPFAAPAAGNWVLAPFAGLTPNTQYRITVTDSVVTTVSGYADLALKPCPGQPAITVTATCNVLGASTANVSLDKLENGETYTVTVTNASNNKVVGTASTPGTNPAVSLQVKNVPNGNQYNVSVANATNTLTGSSSFYLKNCDLPTLAFTGANPVGPAVAGIGFLQFGLMFLGLALALKRRRRA